MPEKFNEFKQEYNTGTSICKLVGCYTTGAEVTSGVGAGLVVAGASGSLQLATFSDENKGQRR
jgi:hypothetical protein